MCICVYCKMHMVILIYCCFCIMSGILHSYIQASSQDEESFSTELNSSEVSAPTSVIETNVIKSSVFDRINNNRRKIQAANVFRGISDFGRTPIPVKTVQQAREIQQKQQQQSYQLPPQHKRFLGSLMSSGSSGNITRNNNMEASADAQSNNNEMDKTSTANNSSGGQTLVTATLSTASTTTKVNGVVASPARSNASTTNNNNTIVSLKSGSNLKVDAIEEDGYSIGSGIGIGKQSASKDLDSEGLFGINNKIVSGNSSRVGTAAGIPRWGVGTAGILGSPSGEPNSGELSPSMENYNELTHGMARPKSRQEIVGPGSSVVAGGAVAPGGGINYTSKGYNVSNFWKARRVLFYRNGDPFFPVVEFRFKPGRDISTLDKLLDKISTRMDLPRGARYIFSMDGDRKMSLDELEDGSSYVVSSFKIFKVSKFLLIFCCLNNFEFIFHTLRLSFPILLEYI